MQNVAACLRGCTRLERVLRAALLTLQMSENPVDHSRISDERDDLHLSPTGAEEWVHPLSRDDIQLFKAVMAGHHHIRGLTNSDIRASLEDSPHLRDLALNPKKQSAKVSRILNRFHAHKLIAKIPRTRRWRVTDRGKQIMAASLCLRDIAFPDSFARMLLLELLLISLFGYQQITMAQPRQDPGTARSSVLSTGGGQALLDPSDTVLLLLDHQSGLFQTVKDIGVAELRANVTALAKLATLLKIPVITTASEPNGPNGPLMPEINQYAPHAVFVPRKGEVNAWDNEDFVKAVRATGKKTLIMAGVWTSVCVMFPALDEERQGSRCTQ